MKNLAAKIKERLKTIIVNAAIDTYIRKIKDFFFIEIGAGDGIMSDSIRGHILRWKWRGILVEPVKDIFERLVDNYKGHDNLIFENIAISDKNEIRDFYRLKKTRDNLPFPPWYDVFGSFNRDIVLKHKKLIPDIEDYLITEKVKCITLGNLLQKHNIKKVDFLVIDTEGYDYAIIKTIDFTVIKPGIILYECKHLNKNEQEKCIALLKNNGYTLIIRPFDYPLDTFAFLNAGNIKIGILLYICRKILQRLVRLISITQDYTL